MASDDDESWGDWVEDEDVEIVDLVDPSRTHKSAEAVWESAREAGIDVPALARKEGAIAAPRRAADRTIADLLWPRVGQGWTFTGWSCWSTTFGPASGTEIPWPPSATR